MNVRQSGKAFRNLGTKPVSFTFRMIVVQGVRLHMITIPPDQLWKAINAWNMMPTWASWDNGYRTPVQHGRNLKGNRVVIANEAIYEELPTQETADVQG